MENTKEAAIEFLANGGKCCYQYGFSFKGASPRPKDSSWGISELKKENSPWHFTDGPTFYEIYWKQIDGETNLVFNEYSENDLY